MGYSALFCDEWCNKMGVVIPFVECIIGHAFAPVKNVNGGFFFTPSVGIRYQLRGHQSLKLSIGYGLQEYDQLKSHESSFAFTQYIEISAITPLRQE